jgi:hypothetical protein
MHVVAVQLGASHCCVVALRWQAQHPVVSGCCQLLAAVRRDAGVLLRVFLYAAHDLLLLAAAFADQMLCCCGAVDEGFILQLLWCKQHPCPLAESVHT